MDDQTVASPDPLVSSMVAVFGKGSFFNTITSANDSEEDYNAICQQLRQPFTGLDSNVWDQDSSFVDCQSSYVPGLLVEYLYTWLINFRNVNVMTEALEMATISSGTVILDPGYSSGGTTFSLIRAW